MTPVEEARFHLDRARLDLRHALAAQRRQRPDRHFAGEPECPHVIAANEAVEVCMSRWRAAVRASWKAKEARRRQSDLERDLAWSALLDAMYGATAAMATCEYSADRYARAVLTQLDMRGFEIRRRS